MKNIYKNSPKSLGKAKIILGKNNIIAVPTETVYGIAGNAYSNSAIKKIYKLKKRPKINPLIVHYYNLEAVKKDVYISENFLKLYKKFSPGPITYILKKKKNSKISSLTNANLKTVCC
jgi:Putative translation factor (SUA5)